MNKEPEKEMTREEAWIAAWNAAKQHMKNHGRNHWNGADYNYAVSEFRYLWPLEKDTM